MAHTPVNHPLRPIYRALGFLAGAYLVGFGVVGLIVTSGEGAFGANGDRVLGQGTNLFWSIVSLIVGAVVLATTALGRNLDTEADKYIGWGLLAIGSYCLAAARTDANLLGFSITTVVVTYLVGLLLVMAGQYSKVAPPRQAGAPRQVLQERVRQAESV
jgi:uncharacterized membrane protein